MEKRNLCKSGDSSMRVITAVVVEIKLPNNYNIIASWNNLTREGKT